MRNINNMKAKEKQMPINNFLFPLLFIVCATILEMVNFLYLFKGEGGIVLPSYFLFDFAIILMLAGLIFVVHNRVAMLVMFIFLIFVQTALNIVNSTMYNMFGDILSFDLLALGGEATSSITADVIDWGGAFLNLGVFAVMITGAILLFKYNKKTIKIKYFSVSVIVIAVFILFQSSGLGFYVLQQNTLHEATVGQSEIESSDKYLWDNFQFKLEAFKKFGNYGFYTKSVLNLIFDEKASDEEMQYYVDYIDSGYQPEDPTAPLYGDNLIVILCESIDWYAIDYFNTPTLYSIASGNNSLVFTEFYARNRTNNSEGIVLNGSMPKDISITEAYYNGYNFDYALPKVFKATTEEEAVATYIHCNNRSFYSRDITHIDGFGFDYLYTREDYTGEQEYGGWGKWITDVDFVGNLIDYAIPDSERFLTFIATMSTHGPYTYDNPYYKEYYQIYQNNFEQYKAWAEVNTPYFNIPEDENDLALFNRYKSAAIDLDRLVANILAELKERGRADDTSIVLFADHNSYYHDLSLKVKGIEKIEYYKTFAYNIPFMIYSPKLTGGQGQIIDTFCNTYDILPTICDLYGLPQNTSLLFGYSVFSEEIENSFFVSHLNGMFTQNIYSLNISDIDIVGENVTEEEIAKFKENANNFFKKQEELEVIYSSGINGTIDINASFV